MPTICRRCVDHVETAALHPNPGRTQQSAVPEAGRRGGVRAAAPAIFLAPGGGEAHPMRGRDGIRLHEIRFGVIELPVHETVAGRAVPAGLDRGAARGVPGGVRRVGMPGSPLRQQAQRPSEIPALGR